MNLIIITILLTLFGVCLVAFLTWLGISSYRLMKFKERAEGSFKHLERWIDDNQNTLAKELEIRDIENQKKVDDLYMNINNHVNDIYRNMDTRVATLNNDVSEIYRTMDTHVASLNSKIDSRCDKLQEQLKHKSSLTPTGMGDKTWEV